MPCRRMQSHPSPTPLQAHAEQRPQYLCRGGQRGLQVGGPRVGALVPDAPLVTGACAGPPPRGSVRSACASRSMPPALNSPGLAAPPPFSPPTHPRTRAHAHTRGPLLAPLLPALQARSMGVYAAHCMAGVQDQASAVSCTRLPCPTLSCLHAFFIFLDAPSPQTHTTRRPFHPRPLFPPTPPHCRSQTGADMAFELFTHVTHFLGRKVVLLGLYNGQRLQEEPAQDIAVYSRVTEASTYVAAAAAGAAEGRRSRGRLWGHGRHAWLGLCGSRACVPRERAAAKRLPQQVPAVLGCPNEAFAACSGCCSAFAPPGGAALPEPCCHCHWRRAPLLSLAAAVAVAAAGPGAHLCARAAAAGAGAGRGAHRGHRWASARAECSAATCPSAPLVCTLLQLQPLMLLGRCAADCCLAGHKAACPACRAPCPGLLRTPAARPPRIPPPTPPPPPTHTHHHQFTPPPTPHTHTPNPHRRPGGDV